MDRAISQDAFSIPGIEHRRVGGLENCVVSCGLLILPCEWILDTPSLSGSSEAPKIERVRYPKTSRG